MADLKCNSCGEPYDLSHIRDEVLANDNMWEYISKYGGYVREREDWTYSVYHTQSILTTGRSAKLTPAEKMDEHPFPPDVKWHFNPGPFIQSCPACFGQTLEEREEEIRSIRMELQQMYGNDIDAFIADDEDGLFDSFFE